LEIQSFIDSIHAFDLLVLVGLIGMFVLGYFQGVIRRLIGIGAVLVAFLVAAQLRDPFGGYLAGNWTQFPGDYSRMIGFGLVFGVASIGLTVIIQLSYKQVMLWPGAPLAEEIVGGMLGLVQGLLILGALIIIVDPYFRTAFGPAATNELPYLRSFHDALEGSITATLYRDGLIPGVFSLVGAVFPDSIKAGFPGGGG